MKTQKIRDYRNGKTIYEGVFENTRFCLERAVEENICLDYADLSGAMLVNAALDGARMNYARLGGANLMGANLSEAFLDGCDFTNAELQNACLCFSSLRDCNFDGVSFGGTDIAGSDVGRSLFSTLSAFFLNFTDTSNMDGCCFAVSAADACLMSYPPVVIHGLVYPVILMDDHIKIGPLVRPCHELIAYTNDNQPGGKRLEDGNLHVFIHKYKNLLLQAACATRREWAVENKLDINYI